MKKAFKFLVCIMMVMTSFTLVGNLVSAQETESVIFVDAINGNDNNQGSIDKPVQTLVKAQELAREKTVTMTEDLKIYLRGGTYVLDTPITFTAEDSGKNGHTVIWSAYGEEDVVISGGTSITGWTKVEGDSNIWKASANGVESRDLYVNGERATLAREECKALEWEKKYLYVNRENLPESFERPEDLEIVFARKWKWAILKVTSVSNRDDEYDVPAFRLKYTDETKEAFTTNLTGAALDDEQKAEGMRYLQNAYEFLNEPGEFYLNAATDEVYYIPKEGEDMNSANAVLGRLENLIIFDGTADHTVHHITLNGFNFNYTTFLKANMPDGLEIFQASALINPEDYWDREWIPSTEGAIYGQYVDNISVTNNHFEALGCAGIYLGTGTKNSSVSRNEFVKLGGAGIMLGGVASKDHFPNDADLTDNNEITNNVVSDIANVYRSTTGIQVGFTNRTKVEHNTVTNLPYTGISVGWGWGYGDKTMPSEGHTDEFVLGEWPIGNNVVSYNYVENVLMDPHLIDGGGIYTLGRQDGCVMTDNYVDGVHNEYGGIYLDEGTVGYNITNNVITNCVRNWLFKGDYNYIYDNYATLAKEPNRDERTPIGEVMQYRFDNNDLWDDAAVAAIKAAAGVQPVLEPEDPTPDTPTPPDKPVTPSDKYVYSINDKNTNVTVIGKFLEGTELVVETLTDKKLDVLINSIKDKDFIKKYNFEKVYDIHMLRAGDVYHPDESFQIVIQLNKELLNKNPKILSISKEGNITEIDSVIKDGKISFHTDHYSYYAIVTEKEKETRYPIPNTGAQPLDNGVIAGLLISGLILLFTKRMKDTLN